MSMGLSCFAQKLPPYSNPWASTLEGIGQFYSAYTSLMSHWNQCFDDVLEVPYESLVQDQETWTNTILVYRCPSTARAIWLVTRATSATTPLRKTALLKRGGLCKVLIFRVMGYRNYFLRRLETRPATPKSARAPGAGIAFKPVN